MKVKALVIVLVVVLSLLAVATASAHQAGPCTASDDPGHSEFAQHHIVPLAQAGMLGAGGHIPGEHHGYSLCDPSGH
jgi:hypothetical protein